MAKILHGINLESQFTTIKIPLDGDNLSDITKLLDHIASYHPIFITEYLLSPAQLTIKSKLLSIWKEAEEYIQKLNNREITYKEAFDFINDTIIARRVKSMSSISILEAAQRRNLEITPTIHGKEVIEGIEKGYVGVFNRYYTLGCGKGSHITASIVSSKDSYFAHKIQKDKWSSNLFIERLGLPSLKWEILESEEDIDKNFKDYSKPVVIKPTGLTGGKGVTVNINTVEEAKRAFSIAKKVIDSKVRASWQAKIMMQEQVQGEDYRLLVINGKLEIATKRVPAFIVGDGKQTIKELIEETNRDPRRDITNPSHILKPIVIDEPLINLLKSKNLTLESIPKKDEQIFVRNIASMSQGGTTEDFTDSVGEEIRLIVESIAQSLHIFALGIDILCKDISKPLTKENGTILEINMMPEAYLNLFPTQGKQREYVAEKFIDALLEQNSCKKYVLIGQSRDDISTILRKKRVIKKHESVGEIIGDKYYINRLLINEGVDRENLLDAIKCNASLDVIILHYRDWSEVSEHGLGFDHIHTLYITKENSKNREYMKILKGYKRMRLINKIKII